MSGWMKVALAAGAVLVVVVVVELGVGVVSGSRAESVAVKSIMGQLK
jgi:hypothetical protein